MTTSGDHRLKRERLLTIMQDAGAHTLVLRSQAALSWYLEGARVHVSLADPPIVSVIVSESGDELLCGSNEEQRLRAEEVADIPDLTIRSIAWWVDPLSALPSRGSDGVLYDDEVAAELQMARARLLPVELTRFRALGTDAAATVSQVLRAAHPTMTELALAGQLTGELTTLGMQPTVVLVGGRSRKTSRHPLPTGATLGERAMVVVCARRHGLIANLTRWVRWGPRTVTESAADRAILAVEAATFAATVPGASLGDILRVTADAYVANGFAADEWQLHHQGGPTGYAGRDPRAVPDGRQLVVSGQAFAWNPTALLRAPDGNELPAKVEDTVLFADHGPEVLTVDPSWPSIDVNGLRRPDVLEL